MTRLKASGTWRKKNRELPNNQPADAVAKRYHPWPPGLGLTACRGSTPPWSRVRADCGIQIKLKCSDRAILAERRSQQKKNFLTISRSRDNIKIDWTMQAFFFRDCLSTIMVRSVNCSYSISEYITVQVRLIGAKPIVQVRR